MKTIIFCILILACISCKTTVPLQSNWKTELQLRNIYSKEEVKTIKKAARVQWSRSNKTTRENMTSGNVEYNIELIKFK